MAKKIKAEDEGTGTTFEGDLDRLEEIVRTLEKGDLPLDTAISLYEEGMALSNGCRKRLDRAEVKIEKLVHKDGKTVKEDL